MIPTGNYPDGRIQRLASDVLVIHSGLGNDYVRICTLHRWASVDGLDPRTLQKCPHCEVATERIGHERFDALQLRMMPTHDEDSPCLQPHL